MAVLQLGFSVRLRDAAGTIVPCTAYYAIDDATTLAVLHDNLVAWAGQIDSNSDAMILQASLHLVVSHLGKFSPRARTPAAFGARFNFTASGSSRRYGFLIPAYATDLIANGKPDLTSGTIQTMLENMEGGNFTNEVGQPLVALSDTFLVTNKHRRQTQHASRVVP